jgi:hypothetical protein
MSEWVNRCLIVPSAFAPLARGLCQGLAPGLSGSGMLVVALSSDGNPPITYYVSSGFIKEDFAALLPLKTFDAEGNQTFREGNALAVVELSGGVVSLAQINALFSNIDVTEQEPFEAMNRLGLRMIQEDYEL